jgi:TonB family protein
MAKVEGSVSLRIEVDTDGAVTDSTIVSGNPLFARAVKEAVVGWKFPRDASQREVQATIEFILNCGKKGSKHSPVNLTVGICPRETRARSSPSKAMVHKGNYFVCH